MIPISLAGLFGQQRGSTPWAHHTRVSTTRYFGVVTDPKGNLYACGQSLSSGQYYPCVTAFTNRGEVTAHVVLESEPPNTSFNCISFDQLAFVNDAPRLIVGTSRGIMVINILSPSSLNPVQHYRVQSPASVTLQVVAMNTPSFFTTAYAARNPATGQLWVGYFAASTGTTSQGLLLGTGLSTTGSVSLIDTPFSTSELTCLVTEGQTQSVFNITFDNVNPINWARQLVSPQPHTNVPAGIDGGLAYFPSQLCLIMSGCYTSGSVSRGLAMRINAFSGNTLWSQTVQASLGSSFQYGVAFGQPTFDENGTLQLGGGSGGNLTSPNNILRSIFDISGNRYGVQLFLQQGNTLSASGVQCITSAGRHVTIANSSSNVAAVVALNTNAAYGNPSTGNFPLPDDNTWVFDSNINFPPYNPSNPPYTLTTAAGPTLSTITPSVSKQSLGFTNYGTTITTVFTLPTSAVWAIPL